MPAATHRLKLLAVYRDSGDGCNENYPMTDDFRPRRGLSVASRPPFTCYGLILAGHVSGLYGLGLS